MDIFRYRQDKAYIHSDLTGDVGKNSIGNWEGGVLCFCSVTLSGSFVADDVG